MRPRPCLAALLLLACSRAPSPSDGAPDGGAPAPDLRVTRRYLVDNVETTTFRDGALVQVEIRPTLGAQAVDGCYQVTDHLPSGMQATTRLSVRSFGGPAIGAPGQPPSPVTFPHAIEGQRVKFCFDRTTTRPIIYYARVTAPGVYRADPVLVQSLRSPSLYGVSAPADLTIR